ncbi:hypothetical protein EV368DRAFT_67027 [Lentinula lateritia]|uniref:Uncharacterized protein n=1 Tax=Lentinula aff. lateritia TaxID=2804960 RepID=A0ACC1TU45_9AGAR|nr:hypothetical protein F5876DRAFT_67556 [Lentinula aff. lateritia]KAJ3849939.1 hypothetical protein EV368DRAFT_67027 [Lentinula lateritia]
MPAQSMTNPNQDVDNRPACLSGYRGGSWPGQFCSGLLLDGSHLSTDESLDFLLEKMRRSNSVCYLKFNHLDVGPALEEDNNCRIEAEDDLVDRVDRLPYSETQPWPEKNLGDLALLSISVCRPDLLVRKGTTQLSRDSPQWAFENSTFMKAQQGDFADRTVGLRYGNGRKHFLNSRGNGEASHWAVGDLLKNPAVCRIAGFQKVPRPPALNLHQSYLPLHKDPDNVVCDDTALRKFDPSTRRPTFSIHLNVYGLHILTLPLHQAHLNVTPTPWWISKPVNEL